MSIDLSALVLGPCMDTWSKSVTFTPVKSQPEGTPYGARGVWMVDNLLIPTDNGGQFQSRTIKLGIMLSDFAIAPAKYDMLTINVSDLPMGYAVESDDPTSTVDFFIDTAQPDGQGGMTLVLKRSP